MMGEMGSTRGRFRALLVITVLCLLCLWGLLWLAIVAATGHLRKDLYARLGAGEQDIWVQFEGSRMRHAVSVEQLEEAEWVSGETSGWWYREFEPVEVPLDVLDASAAFDAARVRLTLFGSDCKAEWEYEKRDEAGVRWEYVVGSYLETAGSLEEASPNDPPALEVPVLQVEAGVVGAGEGREIGVALSLDSGDSMVEEIRRNGRPVQAEVRIVDSEGEEVASKRGAIEDFGYT